MTRCGCGSNCTDGDWRAHTDPAPAEPHLTVHPPGADLAAVAADGHAALDLAAGPVFRAELLPGSPDRLLLIAHHLVIDVVSWQIISLRPRGRARPARDRRPATAAAGADVVVDVGPAAERLGAG